MTKVWAVACVFVGILFVCLAGFFTLIWLASVMEGMGWGKLVGVIVCVAASIVSFLVVGRLWRSDD